MCFLIAILIYSAQCSVAQNNLVLNPSFEEKDTCPYYYSGISDHNCLYWGAPSIQTPDYFHVCGYCDACIAEERYIFTVPTSFSGYQLSHSGLAYAGTKLYQLASSYREYIQGTLRDTLKTGRHYIVNYYISNTEIGSNCCIDNVGVYFSDTMLVNTPLIGMRIPVTPQVRNPIGNYMTIFNGWQKIEGVIVASGGEKYFSIGNFDTDASMHFQDCRGTGIFDQVVYVYVDDVSVIDTSLTDTIALCQYDSIYLGGAWRNRQDSGALFVDTVQGLFVRSYIEPSVHPAYHTYLDLPFHAGDSVRAGYVWVYTDTMLVLHFSTPYKCDSVVYYNCRTNVGIEYTLKNEIIWSVYPNPANDFLQVKLNQYDHPKYSIAVFDVIGREVLPHSLINDRINISALKSGMYFIKLINTKTGNVVGTEKFVKN